MLTKADILRSLAHPALDPARYWLTAGGAMVLYGLREATRDIDIGCEPSLAAELEAALWLGLEAFEAEVKYDEDNIC